MLDLTPFLPAIKATPESDDDRLILAELLEEEGDGPVGSFEFRVGRLLDALPFGKGRHDRLWEEAQVVNKVLGLNVEHAITEQEADNREEFSKKLIAGIQSHDAYKPDRLRDFLDAVQKPGVGLLHNDPLRVYTSRPNYDRGQFIRLGCALSKMPEDDPRLQEMQTEHDRLLAKIQATWLGTDGPTAERINCDRGFLMDGLMGTWKRGFVDSLMFGPAANLNAVKHILAQHPVTSIKLCDPFIGRPHEPGTYQTFAGTLHEILNASSIRTISFLGLPLPLADYTAALQSISDENARKITSLHLDIGEEVGINDPLFEQLSRFTGLRNFDVSAGENGSIYAAISPLRDQLEVLRFGSFNVDGNNFQLLCGTSFPKLKALSLDMWSPASRETAVLEPEYIAQFAEATGFVNVEQLYINNGGGTEPFIQALRNAWNREPPAMGWLHLKTLGRTPLPEDLLRRQAELRGEELPQAAPTDAVSNPTISAAAPEKARPSLPPLPPPWY